MLVLKETRKDSLNRTLGAQALGPTVDKWKLVKLKVFCTETDTIVQVKKQPVESGKIFLHVTEANI